MWDIKGVIFDLDGTLIDTEALCNQSGVETGKALGLDLDLAFWETLAGIDDVNRLARINETCGTSIDQQTFYDTWDHFSAKALERGVPYKPGVPDILDHFHARNLPIALCTSSRRNMADVKIEVAGFTPYFAATVAFEDVQHAKPAPDPYILAAQMIGLAPNQCIAFEDSNAGAHSARAAGCLTIQVPDLQEPDGVSAHVVGKSLFEGLEAAESLVNWATPAR